MKHDPSFSSEKLSFSLESATEPKVIGPSRFAIALKKARFARGWTQGELAKQLSIPKRSIVSWETAERIPSVGTVVVLLDALSFHGQLSLHQELLCAYIVDDLEHQENRENRKPTPSRPFIQHLLQLIEPVLKLPTSESQLSSNVQERVEEQMPARLHELSSDQVMSEPQSLEPLFSLMSQLQQRPELITVARDFIRELALNA